MYSAIGAAGTRNEPAGMVSDPENVSKAEKSVRHAAEAEATRNQARQAMRRRGARRDMAGHKHKKHTTFHLFLLRRSAELTAERSEVTGGAAVIWDSVHMSAIACPQSPVSVESK